MGWIVPRREKAAAPTMRSDWVGNRSRSSRDVSVSRVLSASACADLTSRLP